MKLYRTMLPDPTDGLPTVGDGARMLGVRVPPNPSADIRPDVLGVVHRGTGGMSVVADDPLDMRPWLLPRGDRFRGTSKKGAVYEADAVKVQAPLALRPDGPPHHVVEPSGPLPIGDFQFALRATRSSWRIY